MSRLFLVRHAAVDTAGRYWSATDLPLSSEGVEQLPVLVQRLANEHLAAIYASDRARARRSAVAMAKHRSCAVELDERLREIDFGSCEGLTFNEIASRWPDVADSLVSAPTSFVAPGGESFVQFTSRVNQFVRERLTAIDSNIVVVAHRGTLGVIAAGLLGRPPDETLRWPFPPGEMKVLNRPAHGQSFGEPADRSAVPAWTLGETPTTGR